MVDKIPGFVYFLIKIKRKEMEKKKNYQSRHPPTDTTTDQGKGTNCLGITDFNPWWEKTSYNTNKSAEDYFHAPRRAQEERPNIDGNPNKKKMM